eukprot:gnl/TRDRNA2_/TRDRNA2_80521_c0_seq1.p1 gnl/TRDRNA2_/TRDRNA2_80521_c0~~gnl/TRDRNA2_/TRDRNA2_80521_c0_seq1.p1  ORF type:complete len:418 (-),score=56.97 gnl/TRDRNA2_/TRDRNA2_80521_c0_seq1:198-1451(-)
MALLSLRIHVSCVLLLFAMSWHSDAMIPNVDRPVPGLEPIKWFDTVLPSMPRDPWSDNRYRREWPNPGRDEPDDPFECPLPPKWSWYRPPKRVALSSHPRSGSTWLRYLIERASGVPCGIEKTGWANVLPHYGGEKTEADRPNREGIVTKTHSTCAGCWRGAKLSERQNVKDNTTYSKKEIRRFVPDQIAEALLRDGMCLHFGTRTLPNLLSIVEEAWNKKKKHLAPTIADDLSMMPCRFEYDAAIFLYRDPLDVFKSNYHYRTRVLRLRPPGSWPADDYEFPKERARSYVEHFYSWQEFGKHAPMMSLRYEELKKDPVKNLRRILDFVNFTDLEDKLLECSVEASSMDNLKEQPVRPNEGFTADEFFGSRNRTDSQEDLTYPEALLDYFESIGLFTVREQLGYGGRPAAQEPKQEL